MLYRCIVPILIANKRIKEGYIVADAGTKKTDDIDFVLPKDFKLDKEQWKAHFVSASKKEEPKEEPMTISDIAKARQYKPNLGMSQE